MKCSDSIIDKSVAYLHTEQRNIDTIGIDKQDTETIVRWINREDKKVAYCVEKAIPQISNAIDLLYERMKDGGRLVYAGAGTSARIAYMDAAECPPTYKTDYETVITVMAGGRDCVFRANEHLEDEAESARKDLRDVKLCEKDTVVAATASGRTPYCVAALKYAEEVGAGRISIACNPDSEVGKNADVAIEIDTGAEAIMGSTRMKAGTAQKFVMNMLSTGVMIRLGHTYDNLLLGYEASNSKVSDRHIRMYAEAVGNPDLSHAKEQLEKAHGNMRIAFFMEMYGVNYEKGREVIEQTGGNIKKALSILEGKE
ncbi:MAG: N-acetylmuramic acid 6-phosphate etherase [Ruminococcaceae bacterium]|nr:N-acetylmuramic acid 6-phosphate etherase [Oscillospiraceae bacterium]